MTLNHQGQTVPGKTHTMQGSGVGAMREIIPRAIEVSEAILKYHNLYLPLSKTYFNYFLLCVCIYSNGAFLICINVYSLFFIR